MVVRDGVEPKLLVKLQLLSAWSKRKLPCVVKPSVPASVFEMSKSG